MIKSMTGFGRGEYQDAHRRVLCEVRSVNHRYLDVSIRLPRRYSFAEEAVREAVRESVRRGKVEVTFTVEMTGDEDTMVEYNAELAAAYLEKLGALSAMMRGANEADQSAVADELRLEHVASLPDVLKVVPNVEDEEGVTHAMTAAAKEALAAHAAMREKEGQKLAEDMAARGETILTRVKAIEERGPALTREYVEKMKARIRELVADQVDLPEDRVALEAAVFADKSNITEEIVRLRSHIAQMNDILASKTPEGKKLDFLIQEMNREANTIGSKANDLDITSHMLEIKSEVEKIREQVQNIE